MTRTARTQDARTFFRLSIRRFLRWWERAPLWQSIWFVPLVMALYVIAFIKNLLTGE